MAKERARRDDKKATKSIYSVKNDNIKQGRSTLTGQYIQSSVKSGGKIHTGKSKVALAVKNVQSISVMESSGKSSRSAAAVMAPISKKPESQMTSIEKMEATRDGISKIALEELKEKTGFDYDQLSAVLGVARTTLLNKKGNEKFPVSLSEKIMSLADLYSFGYEIFGDTEEFNQWIFQPLPALGGQAPYTLLDNQYGREEVKNLIGRIAYGAYS